MSEVKFKLTINVTLDTDEYAIPADGNINVSLEEDIQEILETNLAAVVTNIKVIKTGGKLNAEVRDQDYDGER